MSGWSAIEGTHSFVVGDRAGADGLARALAAHGFARVVARPVGHAGWAVDALDEGPYPVSPLGFRTFDAVGRAAALVARDFGGYSQGGGQCEPDMLHLFADGPIVHTNPGARPPIPDVVITPAPPVHALDLGPHSAAAGAGTLVGLDVIEWSALNHAHGSAENIPALIRALALNTSTWDATLGELFGDDLLHQGDCYSATAPALPFVAQLAISDALPPARRLDLHVWLLSAADCWAASLLADADRAAAQRRFPTAAPWTQEVHLAVGDQVRALLGRWPAEPPAIQFALACLAALYPQHSRHLTHQTAALAATYAGTQPGVYLELAAALHRTDDHQSLTLAHQIATWEDDLDQDWLHAPNTTAALRAAHALATGALYPSATPQLPDIP